MVRDQFGRTAQSDAVKELLGLRRNESLPAEGMSPRWIQGVEVWVRPLAEARTVVRWGRELQRRPFALRVRCSCPQCGRDVALGRLAQHLKAHRKPAESPDYDPGQRPRS